MELVIGKALLEEMDVPTMRAKLIENGFDLTAAITQRIDDNGDAVFSQGEDESPSTPRVIAGLQEGRIVNYVMLNGAIRPLIVVNAWDRTGIVNGVLLFDGANDNGNFPQPLIAGHSGHLPLCAALIASAKFDDGKALVPGTWHFPTKQACVAAAVDAAALETAMLPIIDRLMDTINAKLDACVNACAELTATPAAVSAKDCNPPEVSSADLDMADHLGKSSVPEVTASATVETPADVAHNGAPVNEPEFGIEPMTGTDLDAKTPELPY